MANSCGMYQGLSDGEKNSSRVLAPPGGKSSNIFGAADEPQGDRGSAHSAASSKRNDSTVFGAPTQENVNRVHRKDDDSQSTIFGAVPEAATTTPVKAKAREDSNIFGNSAAPAGLNANTTTKSVGGFNPITGAAYGDSGSQQARPSTKVIANPGGGADTRPW